MHLVCSWHLPTSMATREHHLCAPGVRWWVRTVRFCVWKGCISMRNTPIIAAFGITPSLHSRTTAPSLLLAFAHIHGEVSTPIFALLVGPDTPVLSVVEGVHYFDAKHPHYRCNRHHPVSAQANHCTSFASGHRPHPWRGGNTIFAHPECGGGSGRSGAVRGRDYNTYMQNDPILAAFGITPSPHRRITAPRLLLAFAHIHSEAGTPSLRTRSAVVGPNGPVLCAFRCVTPPLSLHSASLRLCTGEPQHLVCFWPSPTSMARL
jgi:hypothetical protein